MNRRALTTKTLAIDKILAGMYGAKKQSRFSDPTEELILTVLSQNTNDTNRDRAFRALKAKFPAWADIVSSRPVVIENTIKTGGLAGVKSRRIKKILQQVGLKSPDYSLTFLQDMSDTEVWEYLVSFDGVGPKTASCVMMFSLGRNTMPVDTHVHRISKRLGLIPENLSAESAHDWFREQKLPVDLYQLHLNMIQHGRTLCRPANPKCQDCGLKKKCLFFESKDE